MNKILNIVEGKLMDGSIMSFLAVNNCDGGQAFFSFAGCRPSGYMYGLAVRYSHNSCLQLESRQLEASWCAS
jgi:hypothetical protein